MSDLSVQAVRRRVLEVPEESNERAAGMEVFYTETPPLGGRLRKRAEDFVVEEVGTRPRETPSGKHLAVCIRLTNWEHNAFIRDASRKVGVGRNAVGFAGTKDKRAVTTQWFSFLAERLADEQVIERLSMLPRVEVLDHVRTQKGLRLGMHEGNRFQIVVRDIEGEQAEIADRLAHTVGALEEIGGVPNFFGIQRFGATRPITHLVGESIVRGELEEAVVRYVAGEASRESEDAERARAIIRESRDWKEAQRILPKELKFELAVVQHLSAHPDDYAGALRNLPSNLVLLFCHAYQSYLFNRMLSERIRQGLPLHVPVEGDIVLPIAEGGILDVPPVHVTPARFDKVLRQVEKGRALVSLPLLGYDTPMASGAPGEVEARILDEESVEPQMFYDPPLREASSRGLRRAVVAPVGDLGSEVTEDETAEGKLAAHVRFYLPKGSYATTLLREVLKAPDTTIY